LWIPIKTFNFTENKKSEIESTSTKDFTSSEFTVTDDALENKINSDATSSPLPPITTTTTIKYVDPVTELKAPSTTKAPTTKAPVFLSTNYPPLPVSSQEALANGNDNPLGIKIKEITKAEEIRVTDDRKVNVMPFKDKTQTKVQLDEETSSNKRAELINNLEHIDVGGTSGMNVSSNTLTFVTLSPLSCSAILVIV
jgi:hypothetical protein